MQILLDNIALGLVKNIMIKNQGESMYVDHLPCMVKFVNIFYRICFSRTLHHLYLLLKAQCPFSTE